MRALVAVDPSLGEPARARPAVHARRGRVRRPPRDGDHARRRADATHPRPPRSTGRRASRPLPTSPGCSRPSWGGTTTRRPRRSTRTGRCAPPRSSPRAAADRPATVVCAMTRPTPPIELTGAGSRWGEPDPLPDGFAAALAAVCPTTDLVADVRRGKPRLVAAGAALVARRRGAAPGRDRGAPHRHRAGGRRARRVQRRPRAGHAGRWPQRGVRRIGARVRRRPARPHGPRSHRRGRRHVRRRRGRRRHVRARSRARAERPPRPHRRSLPAELRHRHRRRVGGVPWRRPVLDALRQDRGHGGRARGGARRRPRRPHRRCAGGRRRARSQPGVRRLPRARSA